MAFFQLKDVNKKIRKFHVLKDINYEFKEKTIYGLYGKNGSGKTMLLRAISGLIYPNSGEILINQKVLHKDISFPPSLGVIVENTALLPQYEAFKNLKILSKIKKIASDEDIIEAIHRVGLDPHSKLKVGKFSLGMKQRLSIAQAIFEKPDIILLDEPTNAIDEEGVLQIYQLLKEEKARGATIILTSHHKQDLEVLADQFIGMKDGRIILDKE
ncbi:ATP-binding cassette domain-containing protein [Bacillus rubiinfantis]|uniref:ATP-binding cassette domain-containing protein n=1 Tax=Bacillus rubiinfantis TaxID=1499680 RepID=UPI0005AA60D2|nr:ATP-binding cassette domain-containing protein [Bacillus rubiinfantis]